MAPRKPNPGRAAREEPRPAARRYGDRISRVYPAGLDPSLGASWLNLVERWFALLTEKQLRRGVHHSSRELESVIYRYLHITNENPKRFVWTKTADHILEKVKRYCQRTLETGD